MEINKEKISKKEIGGYKFLNWYKIELTNDDVINGKLILIQNEYEKIFMLNRAPKEAAIFASSYPN